MNTYCYEIYHISLETFWWVLSNASLIMWIRPVVHKILANRDFTVTDDLISQSFVIAFVHHTYVLIAIIWSFMAQLSLWKSVYWLWRYKLNEVCDTYFKLFLGYSSEIGHCKVDFCNVHVKLCWISVEVEMTLE